MENLCKKRELILPGDFSLIALLLLPGSHKEWILLPFSARPFRLSFSVPANVRLHCRNTSSWCLKMRISDNWHSPTNSCGLTLPLRCYKSFVLRDDQKETVQFLCDNKMVLVYADYIDTFWQLRSIT